MRKPTIAAARPMRGPSPAEAGANLLVHDLKNLAGRLAALCQNLSERYEEPLFKRTALDVLNDTASHLQRLAVDLRNHEGRLMVKLRVSLNQIVEQALLDTRPDLAGEVQLEERYVPLPRIWGDAYLLRRAFACAIENALEAMSGKGDLAVSTSLTRRRDRSRITVEIADDGPGMSETFLREKLYEPFATTKEHGLGLGVYTIRQVAALHGGSVRILSRKGSGTRVRFHFPLGD